MATQLASTDPPYHAFGTLLTGLRQKAGIAHQSDLAQLLRTTQQTVSRWEAGLSRPRDKQMPLLASTLRADVGDLLNAAGYAAKLAVAAFDQPFPVDALSPTSFERFCLYLLAALYPEADVHLAGAQGHTQDGIDIAAIFPDQKCYTFQCKRAEEFGAQKVHTAIAAHKAKSTKQFLLLSRIASPQARNAVRQHDGWDLWDKEDISRKIRSLAKDAQRRLVDTFFRGQHLALLGETERGPWQTAEEFFRPFAGHGAFSHAWTLVGRVKETAELKGALSEKDVRVVFLIGPGGSGKSRVLKQTIDEFESEGPAPLLRFLSPTETITAKSLDELGDCQKILVADDAHDRDDLGLLFQHAATFDNVRLVLSLRSYGLDYIKAQASRFALSDNFREVRLQPLSLNDATALAREVLQKFSGPIDSAKDIARLTLDCPLATVIGAQVVAKDRVPFEIAKNESAFRSTLMGKFRDVIAGEIGQKSDAEPIRKLLKILALVQPFDPDDPALLHIAQHVENLHEHQVKRLIRLLSDAGVLFKRGGAFRLSPDLLADYIIENACIGLDGKSTGYAELVFSATSDSQVERILLNLGKLDWRRTEGDPSESPLLEGIWQRVEPSRTYRDPHIQAVTAVAYYQPSRALQFVERLLHKGEHLEDLPRILKYVAYSYNYLRPACELLWTLGSRDERELGRTPDHGIRILAELCAVEPGKSVAYNEAVVDFALALVPHAHAWTKRYSPFDILEGVLKPDGHKTTFHGRSVSFQRFQVNLEAVNALRAKVIETAISLLPNTKTRIAMIAAHSLESALRYPMDATQEDRERWTTEFLETLNKIHNAVKNGKIDPFVLIEIGRSVSWHAHYAKTSTSAPAKRILASLPRSLSYRTMLALTSDYGDALARIGDKQREEQWASELKALTSELLSLYPDAEVRRSFVERTIAHMEQSGPGKALAPHGFYWMLMNGSSDLAQATIEDALANPESRTAQFAAMALAKHLREDHDEGLRVAKRFQASGRRDLLSAIGRAYFGVDFRESGYGEEDLALIKSLLASEDEQVAGSGIAALKTLAKCDRRLAVNLLHEVNLGASKWLAEEAFGLFYSDDLIPFELLSENDVKQLLGKLRKLPALEGYWTETFLSKVSKTHAREGVEFFRGRVEHAADREDWGFRPCNYGPYCHVPLAFRESPEFPALLREVARWTLSRNDYKFREYASQLFDSMFRPLDATLVDFLHKWLDTAGADDVQVISRIIRESESDFVVDHVPFVIRLVGVAKKFDPDVFEAVTSNLYASAVSGMRSGTLGEPFPQDLKLKAAAEQALQNMPRFSPAYQLYQWVYEHAEKDIKRSRREAEKYDDEG